MPCVGERDDGRYARVTPQEQIRMVMAELEEAKTVPNLFGLCFWHAGCQLLDTVTADSFENQGLFTAWHNEPFNLHNEMPLVQHLIDNPDGDGNIDPEPPEEEPEVTEPITTVNDAGGYGVSIELANVEPGQQYYKCVRVHHLTPEENNGQQHCFFDVLDESGARMFGARVEAWWGTGADERAIATVDKPANELAGTNMPMYNVRQVTNAWVLSSLPSDAVWGMCTNHADEMPITQWGHPGNARGHHSFLCVWQLTTATGEVEPEPEEPAAPEPPVTGEWTITEQSDSRIVLELK